LRIYAVADQHGHLDLDIPRCSVLIHAGDICPDRVGPFRAWHYPEQQGGWLTGEWIGWRAQQPVEVVCATWGNHDFCGGLQKDPQIELPGTRLAIDSVVEIDGLKIWCSPWSNQFMRWAFMKSPEDLGEVYANIPAGVDVIVSHQPPYGYGDQTAADLARSPEAVHLGSQQLLAAIDRVKPRAVVCGHIHTGYGRYVHGTTRIYHVSVVDDDYRLVRGATEIVLD
jgi:Icc-related predicted phosphoesterase